MSTTHIHAARHVAGRPVAKRLHYTLSMPTAAHHRARVAGTLGAAGAHTFLATIGALDLLNYTVPTKYELVDQVAAEGHWALAHAIIAVVLVVSLRWGEWRRTPHSMPVPAIACSAAFAIMFTWAFFNLLWGLSAVRPVSLAGPGLAFIVAAGEHLLATAWNRGTYNKAG